MKNMFSYIRDSFVWYFQNWFSMNPIFLVLLVWFCIQFIKVIIDIFRYKAFCFDHFFSSWWFPSFHTGLASSITMFVLLEYGIDSVLFAVVFSFSLLFAYDAMNIRFEAGQHAHYINKLRFELQWVLFSEWSKEQKEVKESKKNQLKERIWHTPLEVLWGFVIGSLLTFLLYYYLYL